MLIFALEQKLKVHWNGLQKTFLLSDYTSKSEQAENSLVLPIYLSLNYKIRLRHHISKHIRQRILLINEPEPEPCSPEETQKSTVNKFHRERKILMRRRTKLHKKSIPCPKVTQELIDIESAICSSHRDEKLSEESRAVAKIKVDPKYFFRFAKKSSICKTDIGPLRNVQTNCLTDDKHEMCKLLIIGSL